MVTLVEPSSSSATLLTGEAGLHQPQLTPRISRSPLKGGKQYCRVAERGNLVLRFLEPFKGIDPLKGVASGKGAGEPPEVGGARGLRLLKPGCKYEYANMPRFTVNWRAPVGLDAQNPPLERKRNEEDAEAHLGCWTEPSPGSPRAGRRHLSSSPRVWSPH